MKKFLSVLILAALLIACVCVASAEDLFPVKPSGKDFIHNPNTYCNPISLTIGNGGVMTTGEPIIRVYDDMYLLITRGQRGYFWSYDFVDWTYVDAPNVVSGIPGFVEIDGELYSYAGNGTSNISKAIDIKAGEWEVVGTFSAFHNNGKPTGGYGDASMLYNEETGRLYMYYGWSQLLGIRVVEIDKNTWQEIGEPAICIWGDPYTHGWETRYASDNIFPYFSHRSYRPEEYGWTEGGHPLQVGDKFYLMYASIGLEFYSYGHGVYWADDPMGPFHYDENNPLTLKTTGIVPGAGHGSIWLDKNGDVWCVTMLPYPLNGGNGHTLMSLYAGGIDADGMMYALEEYGDYPLYLPGKAEEPSKGNYTGWTLLTLDKKVEVSSELDDTHYAAYAVNEDVKTYWCAATGNPGEYITVDLGAECDIRGIQILWDRNNQSGSDDSGLYRCYTVEASKDGENWDLIIDKSENTQDLPSDYVELPAPVYARYLKLTNVYVPKGGNFAVKGFRAFGNPETSTFTKVPAENVKVVRNQLDRRYASLVWDAVEGAEGYTVRYGIAPDKLFNSYVVYWDTYLNVPSLNINPEYYWEVEAFSSGTPRYVENTFQTRGRGVEIDLIKTEPLQEGQSSATRTTTRIMTYETYGTDEVYVFDNIVPGTYEIDHTFGVGILDAVELTEADLIGEGTEPTQAYEDLTTFGVGSTYWGNIDVYVYPGAEYGRIELVLDYE